MLLIIDVGLPDEYDYQIDIYISVYLILIK